MNNKIIVALDVATLKAAEQLVDQLGENIYVYKVGMQLFTACGPAVIEMLHTREKKVFLDLKFHDIPATVAKACVAATDLGVFMMNVHSAGGAHMLQEAARAVAESAAEKNISRPLLIGVTVLTSQAQNEDTIEEVLHRAQLCKQAGLDGVVASALEARVIKEHIGTDFVVVTPGIRPEWASADDQQRITTPTQALREGADHLVIGRPITAAADPRLAVEKILSELL